MAKILIATTPMQGHVNPMISVALELQGRGHNISWYTGRKFKDKLESLDFNFLPIKKALDYDDSRLDEQFPDRKQLTGISRIRFDIVRLMLDSAIGQYEDLRLILKDFPADIILSDYGCLGPCFIREKGGPPWVILGIIPLPITSLDTAPFGTGLYPSSTTLGRLRNRFLSMVAYNFIYKDMIAYGNRIRMRVKLPAKKKMFAMNAAFYCADLVLQGTVPSFEYPRSDLPGNIQFTGPFLSELNKDFNLPAWWDELDTKQPVVFVTQGTLTLDYDDLIKPVINALSEEKILVVATTGGKPVSELVLDPLPVNVRIESYIPYQNLLPRVDIMITNGGYGGVQTALSHGIPIIAAGNTEDKREVCARVAWSGVGINLKTKSPSPRQILKAVKKILADPGYKQHARCIQQDIKKSGGAVEAASLIEGLLEPLPTLQMAPFDTKTFN